MQTKIRLNNFVTYCLMRAGSVFEIQNIITPYRYKSFNNLFLLSAAVFPTGSNTNPTFTVLALAKRLIESDHF